jgi:ferrous iron transport protein A
MIKFFSGRTTKSSVNPIPLTKMRDGQTGVIKEITGGKAVTERLSALGLRPGQALRKVGSMLMRGPVTVQVEKTQVAIGFGMAAKILIQTNT